MTIAQHEPRGASKPTTARRLSGKRTLESVLPAEARDLLERADKLVYLFPDNFDYRSLVADQTCGEDRLVFDYEGLVSPDAALDDPAPAHAFFGRVGPSLFVIEVRPRSAAIAADPFFVRRDLLLLIKEYAERCSLGEAA